MAAYSTGVQLTAYALARGITLIGNPDQLMLRANDFVNGSSFIGTKVDPLQDNQWPRNDAIFNGYLIPSDMIPDLSGGGSVINMEFETAIAIDKGGNPLALRDSSIKSKTGKADVVSSSVEYFSGGQTGPTTAAITRAASGLLNAQSGMNFTVFN